VVIATYNRGELLARTLPTVLGQDFPSDDFEVIVVVDGSTDGTAEHLRALRSPCLLRVIEQSNRGQAAALNVGLGAARGHLALFLDDDTVCDSRLIREHLAAHRNGFPAVVLGPVRVAPESPQTLATDWLRTWSEDDSFQLTPRMEPRWPCVSVGRPNTSAPRSALLACGGFDEALTGARDDLDLGFRLWKSGLRFRYQRTAMAQQIYVKSVRDLILKDAVRCGRNEFLLCGKHPEYRPHSALARLSEGNFAKRLAREIAARLPLSPGPLLAPALAAAGWLRGFPRIRRWGVRLLQARMGIAIYRSALAVAGSWPALRQHFGLRLVVLLYHHVGVRRPGTYPKLTVSPEQFERQVRWLSKRGYVGIRPSDWLAWCREGRPLPAKPILLTFDDAYADTAESVFPVLKAYSFSGGVFVVTSQVGGTNAWDVARGWGTSRLMTGEQIQAWAAHGIEFSAHSRTHPDLTMLGERELAQEVEGCAQDLSATLGTRVVSFAYPYGSYNEEVRKCVQQSFDLAFTCDGGLNYLCTDLYRLRRTDVLPDESLFEFACRVRWGWNPILRLRARLGVRSRARALLAWLQHPVVTGGTLTDRGRRRGPLRPK
jgi:GT2 family glycosyltransferase/peptidoglycan/xylan/chitin deacetylase (PgdA/CDA1 family)